MTTVNAVTLLAFVFGYLCGSIPFGLIFTKLGGTQDIRSIGSGNIGATNVLRTGRKGLAAATLIADMLKGTIAVVVAGTFAGPLGALTAALGAFLGHLFPIWLKFKGGKGVATYIGLLLGLSPPTALAFAAIWIGVALVSRYSSLAALIASAVTPMLFLVSKQIALAELFALFTVLLWVMHRENITKLFQGTEGKIGK